MSLRSDPIAEVQASLGQIAEELRRVEGKIRALLRSLPPSDAFSEEMLDEEVPPTLEAELFTTLECLLHESLGPLIEMVQAAACVTLDNVHLAWWERHQGLANGA